MADPKKSLYARLASRFAHLALGAEEEDEEKKEAAEDEKEARAEEEEKKSKKAKKPDADEEDGDGPEAAEKDDEEDEEDEEKEHAAEDDDEESAKRRKALCVVKAYGEGRAYERARWASVMSSSEAKGRVPLACSLLTDTKMSADKVRAALAASPTEARQGLAARMASVPRPDVGTGPSAAARPDPSTPKGQAAEMIAAYNKARGA